MNWESSFVELLLASVMRPAVLVVAAFVVLRLFRIEHPSSKHAVWTAVLIGMLVVPAASVLSPHYELALLPSAAERTVALRPPLLAGGSGIDGQNQGVEIDPLLLREQGIPEATASAGARPTVANPAGSYGPPRPAEFVFYLYLAGVAVIAGYYAIGWLLLRQVLRRARPLACGRLRVSDDMIVPAAVGLLRPFVLLPSDWRRWTSSTRRAVLAHECAHIRRRDLLVFAVVRFTKCILWFNPLVWWVARKVSCLAEMACDAAALGRCGDPAVYSRMLLEFAGKVSEAGRRTAVPGLAMVKSSSLDKRIETVFAISSGKLRKLSSPIMMLAAALPCAAIAAIVTLVPSIAAPLLSPPSAPAPTAEIPAGAALQSVAAPAVPQSPAVGAPIPIAAAAVALQSTAAVQTFVNEYCVVCHNTRLAAAGVALDGLDAENIAKHSRTWEQVARTLRVRNMPPTGARRADRATNDSVLAWLERALDVNGSHDAWPVRTEPLSDQAFASRLSGFMWSSVPDQELQELANRGRLKDPQVLEQQVRRMLADPKSRAFMASFFGGWLGLKNVPLVKPSQQQFPDFDDSLREAMLRETEMFLDHQIREDRSALELLTANYSFLNDRLARHYGFPGISGNNFSRVTWNDDRRAGILGHASVLTVTSLSERVSPNLRGKWILTAILGQTPPDPPPMVSPLPKEDPGQPTSIRARMEQHVKGPQCIVCHAIMDPPGYALGNFNAIGQWQDTEAAIPVDASGVFPDGTRFDGPAQFRAVLLDRREAVLTNIAEKLLTYALERLNGQGGPKVRAIEFYEMPAVREIVREAAPSNYRWSALITAVVKSVPFRRRAL